MSILPDSGQAVFDEHYVRELESARDQLIQLQVSYDKLDQTLEAVREDTYRLDTIGMVSEFHKTFEFPAPPQKPCVPGLDNFCAHELINAAGWLGGAERALKRASNEYGKDNAPLCLLLAQLMVSELRELLTAMARNDLVGCLDGLVDTRYVNDGAAIHLGLAPVFSEGFRRAHESNMSKRHPDGTVHRDETGKVMKGDWYVPVNLEDLVK